MEQLNQTTAGSLLSLYIPSTTPEVLLTSDIVFCWSFLSEFMTIATDLDPTSFLSSTLSGRIASLGLLDFSDLKKPEAFPSSFSNAGELVAIDTMLWLNRDEMHPLSSCSTIRSRNLNVIKWKD